MPSVNPASRSRRGLTVSPAQQRLAAPSFIGRRVLVPAKVVAVATEPRHLSRHLGAMDGASLLKTLLLRGTHHVHCSTPVAKILPTFWELPGLRLPYARTQPAEKLALF